MEAVAGSEDPNRSSVAGKALSLGSTWMGSMLFGILGGGWLDRRFHTDPLFMAIGFIVGVGLATFVTIRTGQQLGKGSQ